MSKIDNIRKHKDNIDNAVSDLDIAIKNLYIDEDGNIDTDNLENVLRDLSSEVFDLELDIDDIEATLREVL